MKNARAGRGNHAEDIVVLIMYADCISLPSPSSFLLGSLRFDDGNVNDNATNQ